MSSPSSVGEVLRGIIVVYFFTAELPLINQLFLMGVYRRLRNINEKLK
jgi:hypothetical protein